MISLCAQQFHRSCCVIAIWRAYVGRHEGLHLHTAYLLSSEAQCTAYDTLQRFGAQVTATTSSPSFLCQLGIPDLCTLLKQSLQSYGR